MIRKQRKATKGSVEGIRSSRQRSLPSSKPVIEIPPAREEKRSELVDQIIKLIAGSQLSFFDIGWRNETNCSVLCMTSSSMGICPSFAVHFKHGNTNQYTITPLCEKGKSWVIFCDLQNIERLAQSIVSDMQFFYRWIYMTEKEARI